MSEGDESGRSEAEVKMQEARKKQAEKEQDELREYEEQRRSEREKELEDIQRLKERREQRKKEREEEERRLADLRQVEEQRRRQEEEERLRKKREEDSKKREALLRKQQEMMQYDSKAGKPNYIIQKKSGDDQEQSEDKDGEHVFEKTKEQLEAEKKAALAQRIQPLNIDGHSLDQLLEKAKEIHQHLHRLESDKYDLEQRFKKQQGDLLELAERSRQMNKGGKSKQNAVKQDSDAIADKYGAPTKITMYSPYERVKDRRTFVDRRVLYSGPMFAPPTERIAPKEENVNGEAQNKENAAPNGE